MSVLIRTYSIIWALCYPHSCYGKKNEISTNRARTNVLTRHLYLVEDRWREKQVKIDFDLLKWQILKCLYSSFNDNKLENSELSWVINLDINKHKPWFKRNFKSFLFNILIFTFIFILIFIPILLLFLFFSEVEQWSALEQKQIK